jgi:hypothetical protein
MDREKGMLTHAPLTINSVGKLMALERDFGPCYPASRWP